MTLKRHVIVGGGVLGLTAAWELSRRGVPVTVLEQVAEPGGLARTFPICGSRLECFYHHYFVGDKAALKLFRELRLEHALQWRPASMGVYFRNRLYPFSTPKDLLGFSPLSFANRIRFGLTSLRLAGIKDWHALEAVRAQDWIIKHYGQQAWEIIWGPLLHGKFGKYAPEIGLPWFYGRVRNRAQNRLPGKSKEQLGYLTGSNQVFLDALVSAITEQGGEVLCLSPVKKLMLDRPGKYRLIIPGRQIKAERVAFTIASPLIPDLMPPQAMGGHPYWHRLRAQAYIGNVCVILALSRSLSPIYWMNMADATCPFIAIIEHTNFIPAETYQGKHLVYLSAYLPVEHPLYQAEKSELLKVFYHALERLLPAFSPELVENAELYKEPFAQPVVRTHYSQNLIPLASPLPGLWIANMAGIYPEDRGINYSVELGSRLAEAMLQLGGTSA
jgi:protoporphyrinogen oxidase